MRKLGRNHGGYRGETIDVPSVLAAVSTAARRRGWTVETLPAADAGHLLALHRRALEGGGSAGNGRRIYLSAGIHGDEPAGPLAVARLMAEDRWPAGVELWVCPCLNPTGFPLNRRENAAGVDLNRDYRERRTAEVRAHTEWLNRQPDFDLTLCLHEDWEAQGFYLYELNLDGHPSAAEAVMAAVSRVCPIDRSAVIDGRPACDGIVRPVADLAGRPDWPEAFYLVAHKTRHGYTLEAPSDFPLETRVTALQVAVHTLLNYAPERESAAQTVAGVASSR